MSNLIVYSDGELELKISINHETIWLTQKQLADLFDVESNNITYHIKNIYKQKELAKNSTTQKIRVVQKEGNREVERSVDLYNNVITKKNFHDRFLIIDENHIYHIGASLKDAGKKTFAFSKLNLNIKDILK